LTDQCLHSSSRIHTEQAQQAEERTAASIYGSKGQLQCGIIMHHDKPHPSDQKELTRHVFVRPFLVYCHSAGFNPAQLR
jgi:hypothetical protein